MTCLAIAASLFLSVVSEITPPSPWQNPANWTRLRPGQTPQQVEEILGQPLTKLHSAKWQICFYQDLPMDYKGPNCGFVKYRTTPTEKVLDTFAEPDWSLVPAWADLWSRYRQALQDQRQQQLLPPPAAAPVAVAPAVEIPAAPPIVKPQPTQDYVTPPAAPDKHSQLTSRYFITCGIFMAAAALIIAIAQGHRR